MLSACFKKNAFWIKDNRFITAGYVSAIKEIFNSNAAPQFRLNLKSQKFETLNFHPINHLNY
tara:strand:- start:407 stop:592 length:186 start_codon:yes stop_codon:yes gene_type:complete